jgi:hypothetical protein
MNFYEALNLVPKATVEEIEQAYRLLARKVHPDFHPDQADASEDRMKVLNLIRDTLTDPERRARYDAELMKSSPLSKTTSRHGLRLIPRWGMAWSNKQWGLVIVAGVLLGLILGSSLWFHRRLSASSSPLPTDQPASSLPLQLPTSAPESSPLPSSLMKPAGTYSKLPPQVVQRGSRLNEILQMMGEPDRIEEDSSQNLRVLYYGKLRLILRNGQLVQGLTLP